MTQQTEWCEILLRGSGGKLTGSHQINVTRFYDDDGKEIGDVSSGAIPIALPLAEELLGVINAAAIAKTQDDAAAIEVLTEEKTELTTERDTLSAERDTLVATRDQLTTERDQLISERDAMRAERRALAQ